MEKTRKKMYGMAILLTVIFAAGAANATIIDLTTEGSEGTINGAIFQQASVQPAGTGVIKPFLTVQRLGQAGEELPPGSESGYNSDGFDGGVAVNPPNFGLDEKRGNSPTEGKGWTSSLLLSDISEVDIGGTLYREFLLDINEPKGAKNMYLSLDQLQIFMAGSNLDGDLYNITTRQLAGANLVYDMDAGVDSWIKLNYALESGSGESDMFAYIPTSLFVGGPYVNLFCQFGAAGDFGGKNWQASDGYEEWATREGTPIPEPATMLLLGTGLAGLAGFKRRKKA